MRKIWWITLWEFVIVLCIIIALVVTIIPKVNLLQAKARDAERKSGLNQLKIILTNYKNTNGIYPSWSWSISDMLADLVPVYIRTLPKDPWWPDIITIHGWQVVTWDYLYLWLEYKQWYVIMSVNEVWWDNANWISNRASNSLTGANPWFINTTTTVDVIKRNLCSSVSQGTIWRNNTICTANIDLYEAKYIIAEK